MSLLSVKNLTVRYGGAAALRDVSFDLPEGGWLTVAGPNGAGKSSLINAISQSIGYEGSVEFEGRDLSAMKPAARARLVGTLAQSRGVGYAFTVGEVVRLGRYAYTKSIFSRDDNENELAVRAALELTGMTRLESRAVTALSGGELQRVFLAQLFAQNPRALLLDEPTNHLDLVYQKQTFELISEWVKAPGRAVLSAVHDLSLAKAYGSRALLLKGGEAVACGETDAALSRENLERAYSMDVYEWMSDMLSRWRG